MRGPVRAAQSPQQMTMTASQFYSGLMQSIAESPDAALEIHALESALPNVQPGHEHHAKLLLMIEAAKAAQAFQSAARDIRKRYLDAYPPKLVQAASPLQVPKLNGHNRLRVVE